MFLLSQTDRKFWRSNPELPFCEYGRTTRYTIEEAVNRIYNCKQESLCKQRPLRVRTNASFLVDVSYCKSWEDIKDDMNGAYTRVLRSGVWTLECDFTDAEARCTIMEKKRVELENDNQ